MSTKYDKISEQADELYEKLDEYYFTNPVKFKYHNGRYIAILNKQLRLAEKEGRSDIEISGIKESLRCAKEDQFSIGEFSERLYGRAKDIQSDVRNEKYYSHVKELGAGFLTLLTSIGYNITAPKEERGVARESLKEELVTAGKNVLKTPVVIGARTGSFLMTLFSLPVQGFLNVKSTIDYYAFNKLTYSGDDLNKSVVRVSEKMNTKANRMFMEKNYGGR